MNNINKTIVSITKLESNEGFYLTQAVLAEESERVFVTVAFLAHSQTAADWREASISEKEEWEAIHIQTDEYNEV